MPVLAAGGIADGRQIAAALTVGAQGVVIGTRFIATPEAQAAQGYREAILKAHEDSTLRTKAYTGKTCRVIRTEYALEWEKDPSKIQPFPMQAQTSGKQMKSGLSLATLRMVSRNALSFTPSFR